MSKTAFFVPPWPDAGGTVFDPTDETFGPIMADIQSGEWEQAVVRLQNLTSDRIAHTVPPLVVDLALKIEAARIRNEIDWKSYYLAKSGYGAYDEISQWPLDEIRGKFEGDDWTHMVHDYELEEAVEQGIGYNNAMLEVLGWLGVKVPA